MLYEFKCAPDAAGPISGLAIDSNRVLYGHPTPIGIRQDSEVWPALHSASSPVRL